MRRTPAATTIGDGRRLLVFSGWFLAGCGLFAIGQAATGQLLPHDAAYLGMTANELCRLESCRILHFMEHDRISFGGALVAMGVLYAWLARGPLGRRERWAWWTLALSGLVGFLTFLAYLGYGYLDSWHGAATLILLPVFAVGLARTRGLGRTRLEAVPVDLRTAAGGGRALLLLSAFGLGVAGLIILGVGMTTVFVPEDVAFIGEGRQSLATISPHLVPLIAHDRAGFGGALASVGIAMFGCVRYARPSPRLWRWLGIAGFAGFSTAVGVHPAIGYLSLVHVGPAVLGALVFAAGLLLASRGPNAAGNPDGLSAGTRRRS